MTRTVACKGLAENAGGRLDIIAERDHIDNGSGHAKAGIGNNMPAPQVGGNKYG
jgi:hypothetical protein